MPNTVQLSAGLSQQSQDTITSQLGKAIDKGLKQGFSQFKGIDDRTGTAALARLTAGARSFGSTLETTNRRVIGFGISLGLLGGAVRTLEGLVKSTLDVDKAMARINATTALTVRQLDSVSKGLFDVARRTGESFDIIAKGYEAFSKQGGSVEQTLKRTQAAAGLAKIGNIEVTESVKGLVAAYSSFGRAGETYVGIANKISAANRGFGVEVKDLLDGLGQVGPQAQELGVPLNKLIGLITSLKTVTGRDGPAIAQSLQRIFARASESTNLNKLTGIVDNAQLKTTVQVLDEVASKYAKLTDAQRRTVSQAFGGIFNPAQAKALLQDLSSINGLSSQVANNVGRATNDLEQRLQKQNNNLSQSLANLKTSAQQAGSIIGNLTLRPAIAHVVSGGNAATELIRGLTGGSDEAGKDVGKTIGTGILKGIGNVLGGPGLVIALRTLTGAALRTFPEAIRDLRQTAGFATAGSKGQEISIINGVNKALALGTTEERARYAAAAKTTQQEEILLGILNRQLAVQNQLAATNQRALEVGSLTSSSARAFAKFGRAAGGYVPAMGAESAAIGAGVGGAPSSARAVVIPNFAYGGGVKGPIVANTSEFVVHGAGGSSIYNRDMIRQRGLPPGATPIAAGGYVPNAADPMAGKGITTIEHGMKVTRYPDGSKSISGPVSSPSIGDFASSIGSFSSSVGPSMSGPSLGRSSTTDRIQAQIAAAKAAKVAQTTAPITLAGPISYPGPSIYTGAGYGGARPGGGSLDTSASNPAISSYDAAVKRSTAAIEGLSKSAEGANQVLRETSGQPGSLNLNQLRSIRRPGNVIRPGDERASPEAQAAYQADFEARALHGGPTKPSTYVSPADTARAANRAKGLAYLDSIKAADDARKAAVAEADAAALVRSNRKATFGKYANGLQQGALGASFASGFIDEGEGGTASGQQRGALKGGLQGLGTGAAIGSIFGPVGTIVGGLLGGVIGGVKGYTDKAKKSFDELAKSIGDTSAKNDQLVASTEQYIRGVDTLRQAREQGASPRAIEQIQRSNQENLFAVKDATVRGQLAAAQNDPEALLAIQSRLQDQSFGYAAKGNAILGASQISPQGLFGTSYGKEQPDKAKIDEVAQSFAQVFNGKDVNTAAITGGGLNGLGAQLTRVGGFSAEEANTAITNLKGLDVKGLLEFVGTLVKGIKDNKSILGLSDVTIPKRNIEGEVGEKLADEISAIEKAIDQGAGLASFIRQRTSQTQGSAIRILGERRLNLKGYSQDSIGLEGGFRIGAAQQEAGAANQEALLRAQQAFVQVLKGSGGTLTFDAGRTAGINSSILGARTPDQLAAISKESFSSADQKKLQTIIDKLDETNIQGARQVLLVTEQVQLQRLELQAEQHNQILARAGYSPGGLSQFSALTANGRSGSLNQLGQYTNSLQQSEYLDSLGLPQGPQTVERQEFLRRQSAGATLASLASRRLGRRVGSDRGSVFAAAQQLSLSKSTDDQELADRIRGSISAVGFNPREAAKGLLTGGAANPAQLQQLVDAKQVSAGDSGIITRADTTNSLLSTIADSINDLVEATPGAGDTPLSGTEDPFGLGRRVTDVGGNNIVPVPVDVDSIRQTSTGQYDIIGALKRGYVGGQVGAPLDSLASGAIPDAFGRSRSSAYAAKYRALSNGGSEVAAPAAGSLAGVSQTTFGPVKVEIVGGSTTAYRASDAQSPLASFGGGFAQGLDSFKSQLNEIYEIGTKTADALEQSFSNAFASFATGAERGNVAFRKFVSGIFADESKLFSDSATRQLFGLIGSTLGPTASVTPLNPATSESVIRGDIGTVQSASVGDGTRAAIGGPIGFARGGAVPAMLTGGEYVFSPQAARRLGPAALRAINQGNVKGYAVGGMVVRGGSGIRDDVPANLPQGSFVIKKQSVNRLGTGYLNSMASGRYSNHALGDTVGGFFGGEDFGGYGIPGALIGAALGAILDKKNRGQGALIGAGIGLGAGLLGNLVENGGLFSSTPGAQSNAVAGSPVNSAKNSLSQFLSKSKGSQKVLESFGAAGVLGGISAAAAPSHKTLDFQGIRNNAVALENEQQGIINNRVPGTFINLQKGANGQYNIIDGGGPNTAYGLPGAREYSPYGYDSGGSVGGAPDVGYTPVGPGGAGATPVQNTITIHNYGNGQTSSTSSSSGGGGGGNPLGNTDFAKLLTKYVNAAVQDQLVQSRRPGGGAQTFQRYSPTYGG